MPEAYIETSLSIATSERTMTGTHPVRRVALFKQPLHNYCWHL